jgi:hypothetical protein
MPCNLTHRAPPRPRPRPAHPRCPRYYKALFNASRTDGATYPYLRSMLCILIHIAWCAGGVTQGGGGWGRGAGMGASGGGCLES